MSRSISPYRSGLAALLLVPTLVCPSLLPGQSARNPDRSDRPNWVTSRAAQEAEDMVSLSADQILSLLRQDLGLLLQAKKLLVRKAYEQGRLLDPRDLTDEALFRLLREDESIRVLITQEIERRQYVQVRPTPEETLRQNQAAAIARAQMNQSDENTAPAGGNRGNGNTESTQDPYPAGGGGKPDSAQPPAYTPPSVPQTPAPDDLRRQVQQAQAQAPPIDMLGMPNRGQLPRIQPDDLPGLLNASATDGSLMPMGRDFSGTGGSVADLILPPFPQNLPSDFPQVQTHARTQSRGPQLLPPQRPEPPQVQHQANPYADVPSLYDLYAQYSQRPPVLERFGEAVFRNGTGNFDELPMDLPVGPDYALGPGDGLSIELWGSVSQRLQRVVDREGRVSLPEVGSVPVSGRSLGEVQALVQSVLRTQYRDVQADVSLSRVRTLRVYIVGDVQKPGAYDVSSLSTPLNALYLAGGPTSRGSLRILRHFRGKQLIQQIDVYDLLLHGVNANMQRLQAGDTILVPPLGGEVTVQGMVRRPAIYEINGEKSLAEVLELAGGVLPSGTLRHIDVERVQAHESRTMLRLDLPETNNQATLNTALETFQVQGGDTIRIAPILPYADQTVYLDGHVFRPGKYAYRNGMKVSDLIKSYNDLLPEPSRRHAEILRLTPPDYTPTVIAFNLGEALAGKDQNLVLKPFDTIRVFGRFDFEDPPLVTVTGEVRDPGDHVTNGVTHLRDAVYLAGGTTPDTLLDDAQIFRKTSDSKLKVLSVNLAKALAGDSTENILLEPKDRVFIYRNLARTDPPSVVIQGEVARPGKYPLGEEMTAAALVRLAGGVKRGAYTETADLTRYLVEDGAKVMGEHISVPIARALAGEADTDVRLHDGDVLSVRQVSGWNDIGATISVTGEVLHPGTYGVKEGERLSSVLERAGGFRADAYPYGAILERAQVRELEAKNRSDLIRRVQAEGAALKMIPDGDPDQKLAKDASLMQWQSTLEKLETMPPSGRLIIRISSDPKRWANTPADIVVRAGDTLFIPKKPAFVMVSGAVFNPTAVSYRSGKSADWYLKQAGDATPNGNRKDAFVIRADGSIMEGSGGLFSGGALSSSLQPGDMVIVPEKALSGTSKWRTTLQVAQLVSAAGIAIQVARGF